MSPSLLFVHSCYLYTAVYMRLRCHGNSLEKKTPIPHKTAIHYDGGGDDGIVLQITPHIIDDLNVVYCITLVPDGERED